MVVDSLVMDDCVVTVMESVVMDSFVVDDCVATLVDSIVVCIVTLNDSVVVGSVSVGKELVTVIGWSDPLSLAVGKDILGKVTPGEEASSVLSIRFCIFCIENNKVFNLLDMRFLDEDSGMKYTD